MPVSPPVLDPRPNQRPIYDSRLESPRVNPTRHANPTDSLFELVGNQCQSFRPFTLRCARQMVNSHDAAEDLVQEAALRMLTNPQWIGKGLQAGYPFSSTSRKILRQVVQRSYPCSGVEIPLSPDEYDNDKCNNMRDPRAEDDFSKIEINYIVKNLLSTDEFDVFKLHYFGNTHIDIACELNISESTVKRRIESAKNKLKPHFPDTRRSIN